MHEQRSSLFNKLQSTNNPFRRVLSRMNRHNILQTENKPSSSKLNSCKSMPRGDFKDDIGLELSLNSYMDVDRIHTTVPQQKTVVSNDLWRTEGNCISQLSAPNLSLEAAEQIIHSQMFAKCEIYPILIIKIYI